MANLSDAQKQEIRDLATAACLSQGLTQTVINPVTGTPMPNPAFIACTDSGYQAALQAAEKGNLDDWKTQASNAASGKGTLSDMLKGLADLTQQINAMKSANQAQIGVNAPGPGLPSAANPNANLGNQPKKGSNPIVWIAVGVLVILLIVLVIVLVRHKAPAKS